MLSFLQEQLLLVISLILILFIPGYFFISLFEARKKLFSRLEKFVLSVSTSIIITDFLIIAAGRIGVAINRITIIGILAIFLLGCYMAKKILMQRKKDKSQDATDSQSFSLFSFSRNEGLFLICVLALTFFIRTAYLADTILPTSTDLGHHMYWSKVISETHKVPAYQERDIIQTNGNYEIGQSEKIADFIIGEHIIFAAINLFTGIDYISYFPSIVLFIIQIFGILAIFILVLRLFEGEKQAKLIALISFLILGPLYAISGAQAKFVSGGVIGNIIGNLLLPVAIYFFLRAFREDSRAMIWLAIFTTAGIFYSHHLTGFIFLFIIFFSLAIFFLMNIKSAGAILKKWAKLLFSPAVLILVLLILFFLFFVYTPSYIETSAVKTAVGAPTKSTRQGLSLNDLKYAAGEARFAFGLFGLLLVFLTALRKKFEASILLGWTISLLIMILAPQLLYVNIISSRISNYIVFPLSILAAFSIVWLAEKLFSLKSPVLQNKKILLAVSVLLFVFLLTNGYFDNSQSLKEKPNSGLAVETYRASSYLAGNSSASDRILKDHNYLTADSWIKLFFMRDYNFPFSRAYFKRYEDGTKKREMCTLQMVSTPNLEEGKKCFNDLGIDFVMLNPLFDSLQFKKSPDFWQVYAGDNIAVFYKNLSLTGNK